MADAYDVLCLHPLPPFDRLLGNAHVAACVEHLGCRYILEQGYTSSFPNCGVFLRDVPNSSDIREEIVACGRAHFRTIADDQYCLKEVLQTKHFDRLQILPCQYNYRAYFRRKKRGWPTVEHLDHAYLPVKMASNVQDLSSHRDSARFPNLALERFALNLTSPGR